MRHEAFFTLWIHYGRWWCNISWCTRSMSPNERLWPRWNGLQWFHPKASQQHFGKRPSQTIGSTQDFCQKLCHNTSVDRIRRYYRPCLLQGVEPLVDLDNQVIRSDWPALVELQVDSNTNPDSFLPQASSICMICQLTFPMFLNELISEYCRTNTLICWEPKTKAKISRIQYSN